MRFWNIFLIAIKVGTLLAVNMVVNAKQSINDLFHKNICSCDVSKKEVKIFRSLCVSFRLISPPQLGKLEGITVINISRNIGAMRL